MNRTPRDQSVDQPAAAAKPNLVERAKKLAPALRERSAQANRLRRLPENSALLVEHKISQISMTDLSEAGSLGGSIFFRWARWRGSRTFPRTGIRSGCW